MAERPMDPTRLARAAAAFEGDAAGRLPPRSVTGPRRAGLHLDADLAAGLEEAHEHGLVHTDDDGRIRMRHELLARAVVADLLPPQGPRYHAALARAYDDIPIIAATHWRAAHRLVEAREAAMAAGRLAMDVEAPEDALAAFELGLELPAPPDPEDADSASTLAQLAADAAYAGMRPMRAVAYAESARATLGERKDRMAWAVLEARLGRYRLATGDVPGATAALKRAAETVPPEPSVERARILALLAQERMIAGAFSDAERAATRALELARALGEVAEPEAIHALTTLAVVYGWGERKRRRRCCARPRLAPRPCGSPRSAGGRRRTSRRSSSWSAARPRRWRRRSARCSGRATTTSTPCTGTSWRPTWRACSWTSGAGRRRVS
jgi:tetratricopeptide (TPR) repeat protein